MGSHLRLCLYISQLEPTTSHSMPRHFLGRGFPGRRPLYCTSIVLWPTNNTRTSSIYKFIVALPHHTMFRDTQFSHESYEACNCGFPDGWSAFPVILYLKLSPGFLDIHISFRIPTSTPLLSYTICTQKFWSIQFDHRGPMSPWEPLSSYFEACPSAFHDHFFQSLPQIIRLEGSNYFQFLVAVLCSCHLRTSFQLYEISI